MIDWCDNRKCFKVNLLEQKTAKSGGVSGGGGVPKYPGKVWLCSHHLHCTLHTASSPQLNINNSVRNSIIFHNYPQCGCLENCSVRTQWLSVHGYTSSNKTLCIPASLKLQKQLWKKFQQFRSPLFLCKELDRLSAKWVQLVCSTEKVRLWKKNSIFWKIFYSFHIWMLKH